MYFGLDSVVSEVVSPFHTLVCQVDLENCLLNAHPLIVSTPSKYIIV